jgi:ADP-heptose:LPS heptosyltransferase
VERKKLSDRERSIARLGAPVSVEVPIVYVGDQKAIDVNIKGIYRSFVRGIPTPVPVNVANLLSNRGNFKHASDVDMTQWQDPKRYVERILVARTLHSIGDMLMASVTPKALKRKYPMSKITVAVPRVSFPLWFHNPWVDELLAWEGLRQVGKRYELYFDITRPCVRYETSHHPSTKQRIDIYMEHCGCRLPDDQKQPFYMVTQAEREWAWRETGGRFFFGIQLRANAPIRNWMAGKHCPQDRNKEIVRRWLGLENGIDVMLFDEHRELSGQYEGQRIFKRPGSAIREIFALMERCAFMLTLDSGLLHGCGALTIPVVALFGNIHPQSRTTYYEHARTLFKPQACPSGRAPCNSDCGHQYCLEGITVDEVWAALQERWEKAGKHRVEVMKADAAMNRGEPGGK